MEVAARMNGITAGSPYISKRFNSESQSPLFLKIFASQNQFQFLLANSSNTILYLHPFELTGNSSTFFNNAMLQEAVSMIEGLGKSFSKVSVGIFTNEFVPVPKSMRGESINGFFRQHFIDQHATGIEVLHDQITETDVDLIFGVKKDWMMSLNEKFPSFSYQHSCSAQIRSLLPRNLAANMYAVVQNSRVILICLSGNQLKFANSFPFKTAEDFIYYVMAVYRMLDLNPENIPLVLFGEVIRDSTIYQIAIKYVRDVKLGKASPAWKFEDDYPFPLHFYSTLLSL